MQAMKAALGRRETASTGANASSSRSHAVCRIRIGDGKQRGMLTLVDLAGSERKHDSMYHDADRRPRHVAPCVACAVASWQHVAGAW